MVLVDTSIWINHFQKGVRRLEDLLKNMEVVSHPFIIGELACGNLGNRQEVLSLLQSLPSAPALDLDEYLHFMESHKLSGKGIGFVDIQLLASAHLADIQLWSFDKKLKSIAQELGHAYF